MTDMMTEEMNAEVDDFLAHYGVKGMKWGVRKEQDSGPRIVGNKELIAKRTAQSMTVVGAAAAGRMLGAIGGTSVAGPGFGTAVGSFAGGYAAGNVARKAVYGDIAKKRKEAKANLDTLMPKRSPNYSNNAAKRDIDKWGPDSAQRINRSMSERGMTLAAARGAERKLQVQAGLTAFGASFAQLLVGRTAVALAKNPELRSFASASAFQYASKKGAARAARNNPAMKIGPALAFTKSNRQGVFNVTSMKK